MTTLPACEIHFGQCHKISDNLGLSKSIQKLLKSMHHDIQNLEKFKIHNLEYTIILEKLLIKQ